MEDSALVGLTVSRALQEAGLKPADRLVIDEPPLVPRGIRTRESHGVLVELYVKRGDVPFSRNMKWGLDQFLEKLVIGIAREHDDGWKITGEVMLIRRMAGTAR